MAARQEARLKEAEAADKRSTANTHTFAEPTRRIIDRPIGEVQSNLTYLDHKSEKI